jgi:hypothetical protein
MVFVPKFIERAGDAGSETENATAGHNVSVILQNMSYVKDPRTDICFAISSDGGSHGGRRALAAVPCEKIPPRMLGVYADPNPESSKIP